MTEPATDAAVARDEDPILIVDDEAEVASALAEQLEVEGYRALVARSGQEARRLLSEQPVALVLLDLKLPDVDGVKLVGEVRASASAPDVVVITGYASFQSAVEAMEAGAGGYIEKPLDFGRLRQIVARSLERRRLVRENAILVAQLDTRRQQAETLYAISVTLASTLDFAEALRRLCREFARLFGADTVSAYLYQRDRDLLVPAAAYHVPKEYLTELVQLALPLREQGFHLPIWQERRPVQSEDVAHDPRFAHDAFRKFPHQSGMLLPLAIDGEVAGTFYLVWWRERRRFSDEEMRMAELVCGQVSLFVRNARLFEQAERDRRRLATLNEVSRRLAEVYEPDQILALIVGEARTLLDVEVAGIRLLEGNDLVVRAQAGEGAAALMERERIRIGESLTGAVVARGEPIVVEDLTEDTRFDPIHRRHATELGFHGWLGVPLRARGEIIGTLAVYSRLRRRFGEDAVVLLSTFAEQASLALEKGRLLAQAEEGRRLLERLYGAAASMESSWSADDRLAAFVVATREILGFDRVAVFLLSGDGARLDLTRQSGGDSAPPLTLPIAPAAGPIYDTVTTRRPVVVQSDEDLARARPLDAEFCAHDYMRLRRFVIAPLVVGDRAVGVAIADNKTTRRPIRAAAIGPFTLLCQQLATALESARLYADARAREREAAVLYDVANELASSLGVEEILDLIAGKTVEVVGGDAAGIYGYDESRGGLVFRRGLNLDPQLTETLVLRPGEGVAGRSFSERRAIFTRDRLADAEIRYTPQAGSLVAALAPRSYLAVPIVGRDEVHGVLMQYYREPHDFSAQEIRLLSTLAHHAAVAIERARLYDDAESQRRRLAGIFDSTSDGMMLVSRDGQIFSANRQAAELLGFDHLKPAGVGLTGVLAKHFTDERGYHAAVEPLHAVLEGEGLGEGDLELPLDGRTLHWVARPAGSQDAVSAITLTFHDVTQEREVSRMKSDFVSFVTHQLRTPLAGIKWMLELANGSLPPEDETTSFVNDARQATERLIGLVNGLLDISRLESGKVVLALADLDLAAITNEVVAEIAEVARDCTPDVSVEVAAAVPTVRADRPLIRQVVLNLLSNAIKYTPPSGRVRVGLRSDDDSVVWSVHDSGIGIPKEAQRRLFEKFYRADNVRTVETEGTGLGLYLVKLIVERHGGRIWCESEEGRGSTFAFALPR